jgi:hypothetical protein
LRNYIVFTKSSSLFAFPEANFEYKSVNFLLPSTKMCNFALYYPGIKVPGNTKNRNEKAIHTLHAYVMLTKEVFNRVNTSADVFIGLIHFFHFAGEFYGSVTQAQAEE